MYERYCPQCEKLISYSCEISYKRANKNNITCWSCRCKAAAARERLPVSLTTRQKMSESRKGSKNSFYGQKHTAKTRQLMSENHADCSGAKNGFFGRKHKQETRDRMSSSRASGIADGRISNMNGFGRKGWHVSSKSYERFYYDSALEKFRMEMLDVDPDVLIWTKRHGIRISYTASNSKQRMYVPDFKIERTSGIFLEEVKGYDKEKDAKRIALTSYCHQQQFQMSWLTQEDLEAVGYRQWLNRLRALEADLLVDH